MNQDAFDTSRVDQQQTDLQSMQWRERYGLNGDPFAEAPGFFFFSGGQRQHHLDTLTHLVAFGEMVLLVTGEEGAGKSRMLAELARNAAHRLSVQRLRADTIADVSGIPGMLARLSGQALLGMEPEQAAREFFFAWTVTQAQTDRRWVLLIDDADALSDESLEVLVKGFQSAEPGHAAILVLAGSAALASRRVCQDPARSQGIHKVALAPLDIEDVQDFIHASFDQVDGDAGEWLTDSNLQSIHDRSEGNIQAIRRIAPPVLLRGGQALCRVWRESGCKGARATLVRFQGRCRGSALGRPGSGRSWRVSLLTVAFQFDSGPRADSDVVMPLDEQVERDFDEVERAREVVVVADESQGSWSSMKRKHPEPQGIIQRTPESEAAPRVMVLLPRIRNSSVIWPGIRNSLIPISPSSFWVVSMNPLP